MVSPFMEKKTVIIFDMALSSLRQFAQYIYLISGLLK